MNGTLRRLAAQALGGGVSIAQIRPAASAHAQAPLPLAPAARSSQTSPPSVSVEVRQGMTPIPSLAMPRDRDADSSSPAIFRAPTQSPSRDRRENLTESRSVPSAGIESVVMSSEEPQRPAFDDPTPLLAERAAATPWPSAPPLQILPVAAEPRLVVADQREPNEVHVHIGRIDIMAVQDASVAPKGRASQRATRPLSEYLARRPVR